MRGNMAQFEGQRMRWRANVAKHGTKRTDSGRRLKTVLLTDVSIAPFQNVQVDHVWMQAGKWSEGLTSGDVIYLDALVVAYRHGCTQNSWNPEKIPINYKLTFPENVVVARRE